MVDVYNDLKLLNGCDLKLHFKNIKDNKNPYFLVVMRYVLSILNEVYILNEVNLRGVAIVLTNGDFSMVADMGQCKNIDIKKAYCEVINEDCIVDYGSYVKNQLHPTMMYLYREEKIKIVGAKKLIDIVDFLNDLKKEYIDYFGITEINLKDFFFVLLSASLSSGKVSFQSSRSDVTWILMDEQFNGYSGITWNNIEKVLLGNGTLQKSSVSDLRL